MKHLKKLSVVLMMTTLFSVSFTSCIDNEVSPLVEAIYEAQADLIAAQAGVQNAEATLLLAQANAVEAQAAAQAQVNAELAAGQLAVLLAQAGLTDAQAQAVLSAAEGNLAQALAAAGLTEAQAAMILAQVANMEADAEYLAAVREQQLLKLVAETNLAVEIAENALATAQAQFELAMDAIIAQMEAAGANLAVGYAYDYMYAMNVVNNLKGEKVTKEGQLALAELYLKAGTPGTPGTPETTWELYLAGLNANLATQEGNITAAEAAIAEYEEAMANPTARETQIAALKAEVAVLNARQAELVVLKALAQQDVTDAQAAITAAGGFMADPAGPYAMAKASLNTWKMAYALDTANVRIETAKVAQYTAAIANYAGTTTSLTNVKNAAVAAVGQNTAPLSGLKGDIKTIENTLGAYGTAPVYGNTPRTGAAALTAYGKLWNADLALLTFEADFAQLTASYNQAANNLVTATNTYNTTNWVTVQANAATALTTAQGNLTLDLAAYNTAKTEFEANPTGVKWFDGDDTGFNWVQTPYIGNHADALPNSFAKILTFVESPVGSGQYRPATYSATYLTAIPANVADDTTTPLVNETLNNYELGSPGYLTAAQVIIVNNGNAAYYVNVENDDYSTPLVTIFNDASNKLGVEVTAPFYVMNTATPPMRVYSANFASPTTYQAVWNAAKLVSELQYNQANAAALLADAQEEYDYQKGLFETGLATRATLEAAVAAQVTIIGKVTTTTTPTAASGLLGQWEALNKQLGVVSTRSLTDFTLKPYGTSSTATTTFYDVNFTYMVGTVRTLTAYAVKWNAELALAKHLATSVTQYQTWLATAQANLTTATREAAEDLIYIAKFTADLAALQAEYDALILTPLYAALNVTLINAQQAHAALVAEGTANGSMIASLGLVIAALQTTVPNYASLITAEEGKITAAEANILATEIAIAKGGVTLAGLQANVQNLKDQIAVLTIRIANAQAIADKFKALMTAALAS